jgi:hypothetical protein
MHVAEFNGARLAFANDPDADRLAASEWQAEGTEGSGRWHAFTGNEIGVLLASWLWEQKYKACLPLHVLATRVALYATFHHTSPCSLQWLCKKRTLSSGISDGARIVVLCVESAGSECMCVCMRACTHFWLLHSCMHYLLARAFTHAFSCPEIDMP